MYLHLGGDTLVNGKELIGIFDIDTATLAKSTREFLAAAEKEGRVVNVSWELPKSFAVAAAPKQKGKVYINQMAPATLKKRAEEDEIVRQID